MSFHDMTHEMTLLRACLEAFYAVIPSNFARVARSERPFHFGPPRASAMFASASAELTFGTLDSRAIAQSNCEVMPRDIVNKRRRNEMSYSSNGNRPKLIEKGLLTPDNCVVALIDHQPQMLFGTSNFDRQAIINNTVAFAEACRVFGVPVVLTTVETNSFSGNSWPQLRAG